MYKEIQNEVLGDSVTSVSWSRTGENVLMGTLDEKIILK